MAGICSGCGRRGGGKKGGGFWGNLAKKAISVAAPHLEGLAHKAVDMVGTKMGLPPAVTNVLKQGASMAASAINNKVSGNGIPGVGINRRHWHSAISSAAKGIQGGSIPMNKRAVARHIYGHISRRR